MAKTANIMTRIDPEVKEQAEAVLKQLGLSMSSVMELCIRQIALQQRIPFEIKVPRQKPIALGALTEKEFDDLMETAIKDYEEGRCQSARAAFANVRRIMNYE